jgi:hypothetical protein
MTGQLGDMEVSRKERFKLLGSFAETHADYRMNVIYQSSDWAVNKNSMVAQEEGCQESDRLGIRASEPVAAVGHPPAKDADRDGGQQ